MSELTSTNFNKLFKSYKNRTGLMIIIQFIVIVILVISVAVLYAENGKQKVYMATNEGTYVGIKGKYGIRYDVEKRWHAILFFENMFSHNADNFQKRVDFALNLIERNKGLEIFKQLKDGEIYQMYRRYNMHTEVIIDSIIIDKKTAPEEVKVYGKQKAVYNDRFSLMPLAAKFNLIDLKYRTENNPFGMLITNFDFINYNMAEKKKGTHNLLPDNQ